MCGAAAGSCEVLVRLWYRLRSLCRKRKLLKRLRNVVQHLLGLGLELVHLRAKLALESIFEA